jgi:vancomycin resistance protein YoaR
MGKKELFRKHKITLISLVLGGIGIALLGWTAFYIYFTDKIYPNIYINGVDVGGQTTSQATHTLSNFLYSPRDIQVKFEGVTDITPISIPAAQLQFTYDIPANVNAALAYGRSGNLGFDIVTVIDLIHRPINLRPQFKLNEENLKKTVADIAGKVIIDPVYPSIKIVNHEIVFDKGTPGVNIDTNKLKQDIVVNLTEQNPNPVVVQITPINPVLSSIDESFFLERAKSLVGKSIKITFEDKALTLTDSDLAGFLSAPKGYDQQRISDKVAAFQREVTRPPQDPVFVFDNDRVKEFTPAKNGVTAQNDQLINKIVESLGKIESGTDAAITFVLPTVETPPKITTSEINSLGINELIGRGTSSFKGSIPSRIYNVALAVSRINGSLIKPGETFSFNNALGDVSKLTGYKEAYVIQNGKTVLGDGGGVCQVSTTLFRAILNAGLPVIERRAHAYRVFYYEQDAGPGLDATVYSPTTDFKFKNDTPGNILIQAKADTKNLTATFELYGTADGRVATITKPILTNVTAPGEDVYIDDPTLPAGTIKQTEHKAWGSKVIFDYTVKRGEEVIYAKQFVSNYQPWSAVYLRGTAPTQ